MTRPATFILSVAAALLASALSAEAADRTQELDAKHKACLERIAEDQDLAFEEAMIWRDQGGGRRARHCEAMALFALGHESQAAYRLDTLAESRDGGSAEMRANFRSEAANFWLAAGEADQAHASATAGLAHEDDHAALRITRARASVMRGDIRAAETELSHVVSDDPDNAEALRYRADVRLRQDRLAAAHQDIEAALIADPASVETALMRGRIVEAIRLANVAPAER
ncbi:tetratricopeptide repeat protein [uncultured Algimonas sp.]|uniref:tetratricopeptide repeat protein n=1 Tax=uncultured Algimonas sp. TaxID=1547920 RepID=UPI00261C777C|nr:tetratricopeptide repeat protein [uncultured Algimonas sp.]